MAYNSYYVCTNPNHPRYEAYKELGIKFKFDDVDDMLEYLMPIWAVASKKYPNVPLIMERIDIEKHFEKGNLRIVPKDKRRLFNYLRHKKLRDKENRYIFRKEKLISRKDT